MVQICRVIGEGGGKVLIMIDFLVDLLMKGFTVGEDLSSDSG